ncbi:MAG: ATP-binding protein [Niabella sp.]
MQKLPDNIIIILGASVFLLLITLFIVFLLMAYKKRDYKHIMEKKKLEEDFNSQLLQSQIEVQEHTFQQIGRELHDNVGQLLSTSRMLIGLTERNLKHPPDTLLTANQTIGEAIQELRSLSKSLDKEWLAQFNLIENLKREISRINAARQIEATLDGNNHLNLSSSKQIILFRIVQEAIQNAVKHGHCHHIHIHFTNQDKQIGITIKDDGTGFDEKKVVKGMGIFNIQQRTELLNGTISFESTELGGTQITLLIPESDEDNARK